ncbi:MAG TPA: hypothetical protein PLD25_17985 [Chloroflexota bacterium]|nr:hypothetical protein [Chloroflexota bacterium]
MSVGEGRLCLLLVQIYLPFSPSMQTPYNGRTRPTHPIRFPRRPML